MQLERGATPKVGGCAKVSLNSWTKRRYYYQRASTTNRPRYQHGSAKLVSSAVKLAVAVLHKIPKRGSLVSYQCGGFGVVCSALAHQRFHARDGTGLLVCVMFMAASCWTSRRNTNHRNIAQRWCVDALLVWFMWGGMFSRHPVKVERDTGTIH